MAAMDFWEFKEDFLGANTYAATAATGSRLSIADTSSAGTPTYAVVDGSSSGELAIDLASTTEVENVCLHMDDKLCFDIDKLDEVEFRVKMNQAALDSATQVAFGVTSDRDDDIDSITEAALFRVIGADSTTAVVVETADGGTTDNNDVATGQTLVDAYKTFKINFATGKSDVRFFIDGQPVATSTTFSMAGYAGSLQVFAQIQKTSDSNTDGLTIDYIRVRGRR